MVRLSALVLVLAPILACAQTTAPPPLETNTGAGAVTSRPTTIRLNTATPGRPTTTSNVTGFTVTYPIVSRFPVRVTQSGVVYISTATITLSPSTPFPRVSQVTTEKSGTNKGAIAGGVIGALAVLIAIAGTLLWFRRRSPAYWKAKGGRGWKSMGDKPPLLPVDSGFSNDDKPKFPEFQRPSARSATDLQKDNPFKDPEVEAPPPALYIREHRQPIQDPFADHPESPLSPVRPTHKRGASSVNALLPSNN